MSVTKSAASMSAQDISEGIIRHLQQSLGVDQDEAGPTEFWEALSLFVREIDLSLVRATRKKERTNNARRIYYLSLEFLVGRLLGNNLHNLGIYQQTETAMANFGIDLTEVLEQETDPSLGNGGLGRLAACFMDSLTTLDMPAFGYGINYRFGLFRQSFVGGRQIETPDGWREDGFPWGIERAKRKQVVHLYGHVSERAGRAVWEDTQTIMGIPWDLPVTGYNTETVNTLRLWESRAASGFDLPSFDAGHYHDSRSQEITAENISQVLYPNDNHTAGKELRLIQQYFFVACSLADLIARFKRENNSDWSQFASKVAIQLNDTHPAIAVAEFVRILMDEEDFTFNKALDLCREVFSYTNHTLLPEALEKWPQPLINHVLPRHMQIIYMINFYFLHTEVESMWPGDNNMKRMLSIIEESDIPGEQMVRMAHLSVIGSHKVNGVAALHTRLVQEKLFPEFHQLWPDKIINVTNGVTPRRWLDYCNPELAALIDDTIQGDWRRNLDLLNTLKAHSDNPDFQEKFAQIKQNNKRILARIIKELCSVTVNPEAIYDVQIKRLHEYKRQQLNLLHIMVLYRRLLANPDLDVPERVFIFGAKAAPGYRVAKAIIHAINKLAERVNSDRRIKDKLKVIFLPNYRVSLAERIIPAANVSEQISTAGFEASGTGNMKFALNGALTIGTLDGANVEIAEEVGDENIFIFGMNVDKVAQLRDRGYNPRDVYNNTPELRAVIDWLSSGDLCPEQPDAFKPLVESLLDLGDYFLTLADFQSYSDAHNRLIETWKTPEVWWQKAIINTASMGKFSSDRSIMDYARTIWNMA